MNDAEIGPIAALLVSVALGCLVGEGVRRWTGRLAHRRTNVERRQPPPGRRCWMVPVLGLTWLGITWACWPQHILVAWWAAMSVVGLYLAAVDLDVRRLPDPAQVIFAALGLAGGLITHAHEPSRFFQGLLGALVCGVGFWIVHTISAGALGFGDVKLAATCGWILGLGSWTHIFAGMMIACVTAVAYSAIMRVRQFAFGPWILVGTFLSGLAVPTG